MKILVHDNEFTVISEKTGKPILFSETPYNRNADATRGAKRCKRWLLENNVDVIQDEGGGWLTVVHSSANQRLAFRKYSSKSAATRGLNILQSNIKTERRRKNALQIQRV